MNKNTKIDISLTLEGDDAMKLLRALGTMGKTKVKETASIPVRGKKPKKVKPKKVKPKKVKPKKVKKEKKTTKVQSSRLNGVVILPRHKLLAEIFIVNGHVMTAKVAADEAGTTLNTVYGFAKKHGVSWAKASRKRSK